MAAWQSYPASLSTFDAWSTNAPQVQRLLTNTGSKCFSVSSETDVTIVDIFNAPTKPSRPRAFKTAGAVEEAIKAVPEDTRIRVISIFSRNSISPLQVSGDLMRKILSANAIPKDFADVICSFGGSAQDVEASSNFLSVSMRQRKVGGTTQSVSEDVTDICYQIRYVEEKENNEAKEWSTRQTGVFHSHSGSYDLFILLHPTDEPVAYERLESLTDGSESNRAALKAICEDPFRLHSLLFSSYFPNWRAYFRYLGKKFGKINDIAMVIEPAELHSDKAFDWVQSLRDTNDLAISAKAHCCADLQVVEGLIKLKIAKLFEPEALRLREFANNADVLQRKTQNAIDLVGYSLTLSQRIEATKVDTELRDMTERLKELAQDTVDDSATVKIITLVSAVYLPGSFVGTLYGMNFFSFDTSTSRIQIAHDFTIFLGTWLPLTILTGFAYFLIMFFDARLHEKRFLWWDNGDTRPKRRRQRRRENETEGLKEISAQVNGVAG